MTIWDYFDFVWLRLRLRRAVLPSTPSVITIFFRLLNRTGQIPYLNIHSFLFIRLITIFQEVECLGDRPVLTLLSGAIHRSDCYCTPIMSVKNWFKNAFAIESPESISPTDEQREMIDKVCKEIVRREMTVPALTFLAMVQPLNMLGAQTLHFFQPFLEVFTDSAGPRQFAQFLEHRGSVDFICKRLEELNEEKQNKEYPKQTP